MDQFLNIKKLKQKIPQNILHWLKLSWIIIYIEWMSFILRNHFSQIFLSNKVIFSSQICPLPHTCTHQSTWLVNIILIDRRPSNSIYRSTIKTLKTQWSTDDFLLCHSGAQKLFILINIKLIHYFKGNM